MKMLACHLGAPAVALLSFACAPAPALHAPTVDVPSPVAATASAGPDQPPARQSPIMADNSPNYGDDVPCVVPPSERAKPVGALPPHAGPGQPFLPSPVEQWRSALEDYIPRVTPGNQRPLGHERGICWAVYLNEMHKRIHPLFADSFLASLAALPPGDPMNDEQLTTRLEVVLTRDGHIQQMGVVRSSKVTAFDIAALDSVDRAQPFGPAPDAIVSSDGFAYLQWEFRRNEVYACSTIGARPYVLATPSH
jgi:TonB family protein